MFMVAMVSLAGCDVKYPPIVITPDVVVNSSGFTRFLTADINETDSYVAVLSRTVGLSKEIEFDAVVDNAIVDAYNELNGSNLKPMPSALFSIPDPVVVFPATDKTATLEIAIEPAAILAEFGTAAAAANYVIPVVCKPRSENASSASRLEVLINVNIETPQIRISTLPQSFAFVDDLKVDTEDFTGKTTLVFSTNINFGEGSSLSFSSTQAMVDQFNTDNGTSHLLLPSGNYTIGEGEPDPITREISFEIAVDATDLPTGTQSWLLPISIGGGDYNAYLTQNFTYLVVTKTKK